MPFHGLKTDLELAVLVVSAGIVSYFVSGQVFSNVLFTFLLASLFFLMGLHLDLSFFKAVRNKGKQLSLSLVAVFALVPAIAYVFSFIPGHIGDVFLVLGASGAALSSPKIWSNLAKADGDLAGYAGTFSVFGSLIFIPVLLLLLPLEINYSLMMDNLVFAVAPFLIGLVTQNYENAIIEDLRIHFSKLAFWLIVLITLVQTKLIVQADGIIYVSQLLVAALFFAAFSVLTFGYSHVLGILSGFYEKEARAIGFIASSRNIAVAFFIAVHVSAEAVMLVGVYYFVRQVVGVLFVDMYLHGEPKFLERIGF
jgi:predicted Na+-dependent transporter